MAADAARRASHDVETGEGISGGEMGGRMVSISLAHVTTDPMWFSSGSPRCACNQNFATVVSNWSVTLVKPVRRV